MTRPGPRAAKPIYRYRVTRLGFHFLFVGLFAIIGGSLRGYNLLLLLAGVLIAAMLVQWRQGRRVIRRTRLTRRPVGGCFAGSTINIVYEVQNVGRWLPIWMIRIEDRCSDAEPTSERQGDDELYPVTLCGGVGGVAAGRSAATTIVCRFARRGVFRLGPMIASTGFPFSLISSERLGGRRRERLFVYPELLVLGRGWRRLLPPRRGGDGHRSTGGVQHDGEFFGLRPWRSGDQIKHIHWRTTARIGEPAVRQFEQRDRHQVCVVLDATGSVAGLENERAFELMLSVTATLLGELATATRSVRLLVVDGHSDGAFGRLAGQPDGGELPDSPVAMRRETLIESDGAELTLLLRRLAIARPVKDERAAEGLFGDCIDGVADQLRQDDLVVISWRELTDAVGGAGRERTPRRQGFWRYFQQRGRLAWWNLHSPEVRRRLGIETNTPTPQDSSGEILPGLHGRRTAVSGSREVIANALR